ncbi:MAG: hypothetical protein NTY15_11870, partial [Planctomycetota bacterium]|nr:hypothetical protein [Planctomycetota bacterium]
MNTIWDTWPDGNCFHNASLLRIRGRIPIETAGLYLRDNLCHSPPRDLRRAAWANQVSTTRKLVKR